MDLVLALLMLVGIGGYLFARNSNKKAYMLNQRLFASLAMLFSMYLSGGTAFALSVFTLVKRNASGAALIIFLLAIAILIYAIPGYIAVRQLYQEWSETRPKRILRHLADE